MLLHEPLPEHKQIDLLKEFQNTGNTEIRNKLIIHNLKLVQWTLSRFYDVDIQDKEDYFQIGVVGLMNSLETYDYRKGAFSSYAIQWIRQAISRGIENLDRTIRIPSHMLEKQRKILKARGELIGQLGRNPTYKEISLKCTLPVAEIKEVLTVIDDPISFNKPVKVTEEDTTLEDTIADDKPTPEEQAQNKLFMEEFNKKAKEVLSDLEYNTLTMFLGIGTDEHTLQAIADKYNFTKSYIADTKNKALMKIKRTTLMQEIERETIYYKSMDYSQPSTSKTNKVSSSVESIVLEREYKLENKLNQ